MRQFWRYVLLTGSWSEEHNAAGNSLKLGSASSS
jgi:hypothetical protein